MIKRICIIVVVGIFLGNTGVAQTGIVKGVVKDSLTSVVLESATVSIFGKDSSLINYQLTDGLGAFQVGKLPLKTNLRLNISYTGFKSFNKIIRIDSFPINTVIFLAPAYNDSLNVTVTAKVPIRMNGDTLEINPAAFKMDPNAVVEDLLTQVPGIVVWADGTITMNGKKIPNVLVDGKPFLGSDDARVATQNLPKNAIDKIQVYQEVDRSLRPEERNQQDSLLTMNIKLKDDKKTGFFGKAGAGYGTTKRYEGDLSFQIYNKKTSLGIGGGANNINKTIGNLREMFQNNTYRNFNPNLYNVGNFNADGINKYHSIGTVFTHNFIETTNSRQNNRLTVSYIKSGDEKFLDNLSLQNRNTGDKPQFIEDNTISNRTNNNQNLGVNYVKTNSYNDNFTVNGSATANNGRSNSNRITTIKDLNNGLISKNISESQGTQQSNSQSISGTFSKYSEDNPAAQFNADLNMSNNESSFDRFVKSNFTSFINSNDDTSYNRNYTDNRTNFRVGAGLSYSGLKRLLLGRYNLFGLNLRFDQRINYTKATNDQKVFDYNGNAGKYEINNRLTNNNQNQKLDYTPTLAINKSLFKWKGAYYHNFFAGISFSQDFKMDNNTSSFAVRNLSRHFSFFRYQGNLSYNYNRREKYSFNVNAGYDKNFEYAGIDQLYTITDSVDVFNVRIGNPFLKNRVNHNFNFGGNINTQNPKSDYSFQANINGNYVKSLNPFSDSVINDRSGKRIYYYINAPERNYFNLNYNVNISRRIKKSNLQLSYNGSYNNGTSPGYIDNIYTETNAIGLNNTINLQFSLRSVMIVRIGKTFNSSRSTQSGAGLTSFKNHTDVSRFGLTVNLPKTFTISSTLDYTKNNNLDNSIVLWNAFATYRFLKSQQAEIKFSAMDMLKQFQNISNTADNYGTTTTITNGLQQFYMLTLSYYPRKFGKAENKKK